MNRPRVLVADDHLELATALAESLEAEGFHATALGDPVQALEAVQRGAHEGLVTDLRMPLHDGLELLAASRAAAPEAPVIVVTAYSDVESAIEAIRRGAYHYLTKPFRVGELALFLRRALEEVGVRRQTRSVCVIRSRRAPGSTANCAARWLAISCTNESSET